jgi:endonuclease/exonuclease/phosphatase (EEP) superfamily protein YafD
MKGAGTISWHKWHNYLKSLEIGTLTAWTYVSLLAVWFVLHLSLGDRVWWIALVSIFAPYLFSPLALLVPLGLAKPSYRYWVAVLLAIFMFLLEYGQLFDFEATETAKTADSITVMSFNIWGYSESVETAQAIVSLGMPDVVALQELSPSMARTLAEKLGEVYPYRLLEPKEGADGRGILSRYPLTDVSTPVSSPLGSFAQVVEIEASERVLTLYNVHLIPTMVFHYLEVNDSIAEGVRSSFDAREQQVIQLVSELARRRRPVIVAGDLNTTDQSDAYSVLARHLKDAYREVGRGFGHTFPAYIGSFRGIPIIPRTVRVDMIFYSSEFIALDSQVVREYGESDHLPVLARFAWSQ